MNYCWVGRVERESHVLRRSRGSQVPKLALVLFSRFIQIPSLGDGLGEVSAQRFGQEEAEESGDDRAAPKDDHRDPGSRFDLKKALGVRLKPGQQQKASTLALTKVCVTHYKQNLQSKVNKCRPILVQGLRRDVEINFHINNIYGSVTQWICAWLWI